MSVTNPARWRRVEGPVKLENCAESESNDWRLMPDRYLGGAPEKSAENPDFEEALRTIRIRLDWLNEKTRKSTSQINWKLKGLEL